MTTLVGREIDWFRDISGADDAAGKLGRVYIRFRLIRNSTANELIMLRNAHPAGAPKLVYPNAVVVSPGAVVGIDVVVRGEQDVGSGFSIRPGAFAGRSDKEGRPIAEKLYAVGAPAQGPDGEASWRVDHVGRYQGDANQIQIEPLAGLEKGNRLTGMRARLIPRSRCDISAWPVKEYNDLEMGEAYNSAFPPPGTGTSPFGQSGSVRPMTLAEVDTAATFTPSQPAWAQAGAETFGKVEIQSEDTHATLGSLSVQFFVFDGTARPPAGARQQPLSLQAKLAAACPRGKAD